MGSQFEQIKNRIESYGWQSQILGCLQILDHLQKNKIVRFPVWNVIILLKWVLIHGQRSKQLPEATIEDVEETLKLVDDFTENNQFINFKDSSNIQRGMRVLAYQQFWLQDEIRNYHLERQIVLYKLLSHKFDIEEEFMKVTSLTIEDFLSICSSIALYFNLDELNEEYEYDGFLYGDYFDWFKGHFGENKLKLFFNLLKLVDIEGIVSLQKMSNEIYQLYETNFLSTKPFLIVNSKFKVPHKAIFFQTCKHFIYDFMKAKSEKFSAELGKRMEKYLKKGLEEARVEYMTENSIKSTFNITGKVVDFFLPNNVLIESKAIELHPNAAVLRYSEVMSSTLKNSIVKSYCQLLSTAQSLNNKAPFYGLVVTYKEMYLGFGEDAWSEFLAEEVGIFIGANNINLEVLPPENLCFIDIDTWDYLIQAIIIHGFTIQELIEKSKQVNLKASTKRMLLDQVLKSYYPIKNINLSYLNEAKKYINIGANSK